MLIISNNKVEYLEDYNDIVDIIREDSGNELANLVESLIESRDEEEEYARYRAQTDSDAYEEELYEINDNHDRINVIINNRLSRLYQYSPNNKQARDEISVLKTIQEILQGVL